MQAELDELLSMYRMMSEDQKQQLVESAKAMLEEELSQANDSEA